MVVKKKGAQRKKVSAAAKELRAKGRTAKVKTPKARGSRKGVAIAAEKVFSSGQDIIEAVDALLVLLRSKPVLRKFFDKSIRDLEGLKARTGNQDTRVAIIGITSSGKSTLMNAILGAPLLPTRVGPSSSRQVLCGWEKKRQAEIRFDPKSGKKPRIVVGAADEIREELEKYGDERFNPGNRENVDEIRVHAPGFKYNRDLVIIDTPGLDAYGLDQHKEVTMKLVLPTVDMILFLTNVKCDSDAKNLEFIDSVTTDDKPLVVVQNKIDSIEPKITRTGVGGKTVEEIKLEHRHRLERLLANAKKTSVRSAPIVQVSAKAPTWAKSNLAELGRVLDEQIRVNADFRVARRTAQLNGIVKEMLSAVRLKQGETKQVATIQEGEKKKLSAWNKQLSSLQEVQAQTKDRIVRCLRLLEQQKDALLREIDRQYLDGVGDLVSRMLGDKRSKVKYRKAESLSSVVKKMKSEFEQTTRDLNTYFSQAITETQEKARICCKSLNMEESQIVRSEPFHSQYVSIKDCQKKKRVRHEEEVEEEGFWGACKRFFTLGCCGYETRVYYETTTYCDIKALVKEINAAYTTFVSVISQQVPVYQRNTAYMVAQFSRELEDREAALKNQESQLLPLDIGKRIEAKLVAYEKCSCARGKYEVQNAVVEANVGLHPVQELQETTLSPEAYCVARLAHELSFKAGYALMGEMFRRSGKNRAVLCGWDPEKLSSFEEWFVRDRADVEVVNFSSQNLPKLNADSLVFLLVNAEQTGSFRGKLFGGGIPTDFLKDAIKRGKIVWVMDSVREHVAVSTRGDAFVDAFGEMMGLVREALQKTPVFDVMACDRELYWSVLLHELVFNVAIKESEKGRQAFVKEIADIFRLTPERRHATGFYVSHSNYHN